MAVATVSQEKYNEMLAKGQPIPIGLQVAGGVPAAPAATASKVDPNTVDPVYKNAVIAMQGAGIADAEITKFLQEQSAAAEQARIQLETEAAQSEAARQADEQAFAKAQAELDALAQQERDVILKQQADYEAMQKRMQEEAVAMAVQAKAEQERLAAEKKAFEERAAAQAEKTRIETEGFERTGAEREVARKKAARSTVARPLLAGATASGGPQTLGYGGGLSAGGSLGTTQTLGVG